MTFGDNESVVNSKAILHLKMHERWVALSHHRVRWAVAAGTIGVCHIAGKKNPDDMLRKHWDLGHSQAIALLKLDLQQTATGGIC